MVKKLLLTLFLLLAINESRADLLLGMSSKGDTMAIAYKKTIRLFSLKSSKTISETVLVSDTAIVNAIYQKSVGFCGIAAEEKQVHYESLSKFTIVNLTFHKNDLIVGFRYYIKENLHSKIQYGLIALDENMAFKGFCLFKRPSSGVFNLQPYFPLEITGKRLVVPEFDSAKVMFSEYFMDFNTTVAYRTKVLSNAPQISKFINVFSSEGIVLNPSFYSIRNQSYNYYLQFPFPVLYRGNGIWVNDAYGIGKLLQLDRSDVHLGDGKNLLFEQQKKRDKYVFLSSNSWNDSMFYLTNSNWDTGRVSLFMESIKYKTYTFREYKIPTKDTYFWIQDYRLYAIRWKDGVQTIESHSIY
jgi:hypothetical protein